MGAALLVEEGNDKRQLDGGAGIHLGNGNRTGFAVSTGAAAMQKRRRAAAGISRIK
jgi:hypothetical protein